VTSSRRCTGCGETKPLEEFGPVPVEVHSSGRRNICRECDAARQRKRRAAKRGELAQPWPIPMDDEPTQPLGPPVKAEPTPSLVLAIPDTHVDEHDPYAWAIVLEAAAAMKPSHVVLLGDFLDCAALSQHERTTTHVASLLHEVETGNKMLDDLARAAPDASVIYCEGNHEQRYTRVLMNMAPALQLGATDLRGALRITERGWRWVPYRKSHQIGPVTFTHDLERAGANAVRQAVSDLRRSIVIGHTHRLNVWHEGDAEGAALFGACFGWLGDFERLTYRHRLRALREWRHGFGLIWIDGATAHPQAVPIVGRTAVVCGRLLRAG
jgi:predicted phosphodiesterase